MNPWPTRLLALLLMGAAQAQAPDFAMCVDRCEHDRNQCVDGGTESFQHCMDAQIICLDRCDPQTISQAVKMAKGEARLYRTRPDLLHMRRVHETSDPGAACLQRCDESARLCAESHNRPDQCQIARHACRSRCGAGRDPGP